MCNHYSNNQMASTLLLV